MMNGVAWLTPAIEPAWAILNRAPGRMVLLPARSANLSKCTRAGSIIPIRLNLDLFQVGVAGEAANTLGGERVPGAAERTDDSVVGVEQAMAQTPLA